MNTHTLEDFVKAVDAIAKENLSLPEDQRKRHAEESVSFSEWVISSPQNKLVETEFTIESQRGRSAYDIMFDDVQCKIILFSDPDFERLNKWLTQYKT